MHRSYVQGQKVEALFEDKDRKYRWHDGVVDHVSSRLVVKIGDKKLSFAYADVRPANAKV